jgi:23S rRNA U2552 (ribose-2'-O)-methylase RlmE/FtsJ
MANDAIEVTATDLEVIRAALNSAHLQNVVLDMAEQYRKLSNRDQSSAMTKALQRAQYLVEEYLAVEVEEEEQPSE